MRSLFKYIIIFPLLLIAYSAFADASFLSKYEKAPLPKLKLPKVDFVELENGMKIFILEDHTLPEVRVKALIKTGAIYDLKDKVGTANLVGMTMRNGGAGQLSPEEFDTKIDFLGAGISSVISREYGESYLQVLSNDLDEGLSLFFDMIFKPCFDEKRINVAKRELIENLKREKDNPGHLASIKFRQMVYGKNSPWARRPDKKSIDRITKSDILNVHTKYFKPRNVILAISGDFKKHKIIKQIKAMTGTLPNTAIQFPKVESVMLEFKPGNKYIYKNLKQSFVRMGHLGMKRHNPDWFSSFVLSHIFGAGSFSSRLMQEIRVKRGMAYSVWGLINQDVDYGLFVVGLSTKANQSQMAIDLVRKEIDRIVVGGDITPAEVAFAKRAILGSLIFELEDPFNIVSDMARHEYYGYPRNYLETAYRKVEQVTIDDVKKSAKKYIHPDGLKILILGPK